VSNFNDTIIADFRTNGGRVGHGFEGSTMLLLHSTGARSGEERVTPLVCFPEDGAWVVVASAGGAPQHPAWFHNLLASPDTVIELGDETVAVHAEVLGDDRDAVWKRISMSSPAFDSYQARAGRRIPLVRLSRR
jgi:deazaflavin-dependent oxidoreductase (nitroreductase family)